MILSHKQSAIELGFSTNKTILIKNITEKSLITQRIVVDYMKYNNYKSCNIPLTNELTRSVRDAYYKYTEVLLNRKKKELLQKKDKKKSINENIMALNQRKTLLQNAITEMMKDIDRLAFEAEKNLSLSYFANQMPLKELQLKNMLSSINV